MNLREELRKRSTTDLLEMHQLIEDGEEFISLSKAELLIKEQKLVKLSEVINHIEEVKKRFNLTTDADEIYAINEVLIKLVKEYEPNNKN